MEKKNFNRMYIYIYTHIYIHTHLCVCVVTESLYCTAEINIK